MNFLVDELISATGGELYTLPSPTQQTQQPSVRDFSFSIDTRTIQPGDVFIALQGDKTDGHDYLEHAMQKGAAGCIVS